MSEQQAKQSKLSELSEVKEFHPFLHSLFGRIPSIARIEYTHGNTEMGADFILAKNDSVLGMEEYIGVIVKVGDIRQNFDDIERQIKECSIPRNFDGGKQKIVLHEIWIVTNGSISNNAQDKINHQYRDKKVKFIWLDTVIRLADAHYPEYWENIDDNIGLYLSSVERRVRDLNSRGSVLDASIGDFYVEQDLAQIEFDARKKFTIRKRRSNERLSSVISKERFILIQGGMGFGKSRLLRQAAIEYAQHKNFAANKVLPIFLSYRDLVVKFSNSLNAVLDYLKNDEKVDVEDHSLLFLIDGVDEIRGDLETKAENMKSFVSQVSSTEKGRVVFASRPIEDPIAEQVLEEAVVRYELQPLSIQKIVNFVERICSETSISARFRNDLERSDLFRSLPRTPISAILLGRVLSSNIKELPSTLPELYSKYLDLALGRWEITKGKVSEKEYETTVILTRLIARALLDNDLPDLGVGDVRQIVIDYLADRETGQKPDDLFDRLVNCCEVLCVDEVQNRVFFRHRTFLEFMFAENMFVTKGGSAELLEPFNPFWGSVNYFYLGKLKDCPDQLNKVFQTMPADERDLLGKFIQAGPYLLAAYQSPYKDIVNCVRTTILDAAKLYCRVCENPSESHLGRFPEVQLLAVLTGLMRYSFEYEFFQRALVDIETEVLLAVEQDKVNAVAAFYVAAIRAGLGHKDAFSSLVSDHIASLPLAVKLGVPHASADADITNDAIRKLEKKLGSAKKGNAAYRQGLRSLYEIPLQQRTESLQKTDLPLH